MMLCYSSLRKPIQGQCEIGRKKAIFSCVVNRKVWRGEEVMGRLLEEGRLLLLEERRGL